MTDFHDDLEARLRASLADRARQAPDGGPLGEQILTAAESGVVPLRPVREHPRWRSWGTPLVAAAAVAAIVGGAVGVSHLRTDADHNPPVHQPTTPAPHPSTVATTTAASPTTATTLPSVDPRTYQLTDFRVRDLTFVGANQGWALGTADCLSGAGTCTALAYSADGTHWTGHGTTPFNVPGVGSCTSPCVTNIRFATASTGYAFGADAVFMTTDSAQHWTRTGNGAAALETLNGNVIRIAAQPAGCSPPGCTYAVLTAAIGVPQWHATSLSDAHTSGMSTGALLSRSSNVAVLTVLGHPAGGATDAESAVYTSADDGATWSARGDPCMPTGATSEVDTLAMTTSSDGTLTGLCAVRGVGREHILSSTDRGSSWVPASGEVPTGYATSVAAASGQQVLASGARVYRTVNGGASWSTVTAGGGLPGVVWLGFESGTTGRAVQTGTGGSSTIWTTHDAGATWSAIRLH